MDQNKEPFALDDDVLDQVAGGLTGFGGLEVPDFAVCPRCHSSDNVIHIDAGFCECLSCMIAFDTEGRVWEA